MNALPDASEPVGITWERNPVSNLSAFVPAVPDQFGRQRRLDRHVLIGQRVVACRSGGQPRAPGGSLGSGRVVGYSVSPEARKVSFPASHLKLCQKLSL
jgi:hypothetical protein